MAFGVDPEQGFVLKRFADIQADLQALLIQIKDPKTNESLQIDFNEDDPIVQILNSFIDQMADAWEAMKNTYDQFQPAAATGNSLSGLVQFNGLTRKTGTPSTVTVRITGTNGTLVSAGFTISDYDGEVEWLTTADVTIPVAGFIDVVFSSRDAGIFTAEIGVLNNILTPVVGVSSAVNTTIASAGTEDETDAALRTRRTYSTETPARGIVEALWGAIMDVDGVTRARVFVNRTLSLDSRGIPPKTIAASIDGGDDEELAETIFARLGLGVDTFGTTHITIIDAQDEAVRVSFVRPVDVDIDVEVELSVTDEGLYTEAGGADAIKDAIVAYAEGGAGALGINTEESGFDDKGFSPGEEVAVGRIFTPVNSVRGHNARSIKIALSGGTLGTADIPIAWDEVSNFQVANISVVEV